MAIINTALPTEEELLAAGIPYLKAKYQEAIAELRQATKQAKQQPSTPCLLPSAIEAQKLGMTVSQVPEEFGWYGHGAEYHWKPSTGDRITPSHNASLYSVPRDSSLCVTLPFKLSITHIQGRQITSHKLEHNINAVFLLMPEAGGRWILSTYSIFLCKWNKRRNRWEGFPHFHGDGLYNCFGNTFEIPETIATCQELVELRDRIEILLHDTHYGRNEMFARHYPELYDKLYPPAKELRYAPSRVKVLSSKGGGYG